MKRDGLNTEVELCEALIQEASVLGWQAYPETDGWDVLLVRDSLQIGVQAKMHANFDVIGQALPYRMRSWPRPDPPKKADGPHFRAVLIPRSTLTSVFHMVAASLRLLLFIAPRAEPHEVLKAPEFQTEYRWDTGKPCWLPKTLPRVAAGASGPVSLTRWKQQALRLLARAQLHGFVTSADALELGISMQTFTERPPHVLWMVKAGTAGRRTKWALAGSDRKRPDCQHPEEFKYYLKEQEPTPRLI